jgi:hypothetical protein
VILIELDRNRLPRLTRDILSCFTHPEGVLLHIPERDQEWI